MSTDGGLYALFKAAIPDADWQRIESAGVGLGIPDANACLGGTELWVEMKQTETTKVGLRPEQVGWIDRRTRAGGRVFIAVRHWHEGGPRKGPPADELWIYPGRAVKLLAQNGLSAETALLIERGGPRSWDWQRVRAALLA